MEIEEILNTSTVYDITLKWGFVVVFGLIFLFILLIYRQVQLMSISLGGVLELPLRVMAGALVLIVGVVLFLAVMVL